jgi:hypothetical protein
MLTFWGTRRQRLCDGISRRDFLQLGALGAGSLTLADLLRLRAQGAADATPRHRAVIMIHLQGGPSHIDMYDLKPDAQAEFRGEFRPIPTNVPGMDICELFPLQARIADRLALLRNMRFLNQKDFHLPDELYTGYPYYLGYERISDPAFAPHRPSLGAVVSKLKERNERAVPPYVRLGNDERYGGPAWNDAAYLGVAHRSFDPTGAGSSLRLAPDVSLDRLADRKALRRSLDSLRRDLDDRRQMTALDTYTDQAMEILTSPQVRDALDLNKESPRVRDRYGKQTVWLQARRLVEAGVSVVRFMVNASWDTHGQNFQGLRRLLPELDQGVHALVTDLHERGLANDVAVVLWGEMGRTPKINANAGRDHWPHAGFALLAGGGFKTGQVIGATTARAERPAGKSYVPQNVLATLYGHFGIDPATTLTDLSGRPMYLLDEREPVSEVL